VLAYRWAGEDYEEVQVEIGLQSSNRVEVLSGLSEGDEISSEAGRKYREFRDREAKAEAEAETNKEETEAPAKREVAR